MSDPGDGPSRAAAHVRQTWPRVGDKGRSEHFTGRSEHKRTTSLCWGTGGPAVCTQALSRVAKPGFAGVFQSLFRNHSVPPHLVTESRKSSFWLCRTLSSQSMTCFSCNTRPWRITPTSGVQGVPDPAKPVLRRDGLSTGAERPPLQGGDCHSSKAESQQNS